MSEQTRSQIKRTLHTAAKVLRIEQDNYRTRTYVLDASVDAEPGQFVMVWLPGFDEKPFSLVNHDPVTVMISAVGPTTRELAKVQPGEKLWVRGPFGHCFTVGESIEQALLVGGGYGVAPLLYLAQSILGSVASITVALGAQTETALLYQDRFRALSNAPDTKVTVQLATDDGSVGQQGFVTVPMSEVLRTGDIDYVFACGPDVMLEAVKKISLAHGTPCQLSWEAYMRCGMGMCGSCEHKGLLLCMDGPVLSYTTQA